ncbi:MAG: hypothetical protein R3C10_19530 [Pirellulales bacterium]
MNRLAPKQPVPKRRAFRAPVCALLLSSFVGCGGDPADRVVVTGEVTFAGQRVSNGDIRFLPFAGQPGRATGAPIVDGRYTVDAGGGVPIGEHQIKIRAFLLDGADAAPAQMGDNDIFSVPQGEAAAPSELPKYNADGRENYLPPRYNGESELSAKVTGEQDPWTLDFALE